MNRLSCLIIGLLLLINTINLNAQTGLEPFTVDEHTVLLMHFENSPFEEISAMPADERFAAVSYLPSVNSSLGSAIHFSNGSHLEVQHNPSLNLTESWTIEFWLKIDDWYGTDNNWPVPIVLPTGGWESNYFLEIPAETRQLKYGFYHSQGNTVVYSSPNSIQLNEWYHISLIKSPQQIELVLRDHDFKVIESQTEDFDPSYTPLTNYMNLKIGAGIASDNFLYGYIDELRISNVVRDFSKPLPDLPPLAYESDNIEFYASVENTSNWTNITSSLQNEFTELSSYWDRPGNPSIIPEGTKVKMYILDKADYLQYVPGILPDWKCGFFLEETNSIILSVPDGAEQENYYGSLEALAKGTLAQLMVKIKVKNDGNYSPPFHFLEGFGLYRGGYRPDQTNILQAINNLGRLPNVSDIATATDYSNGFTKDLIVSYIECQLFNGISYQGLSSWMNEALWHPYFQYYHQNEDNERMMLRMTSTNFDIYCTQQDVQFLEAIKNKLEEKYAHYCNSFDMTVNNRFNIVIFPDEPAGMALMGYGDHYNGGSGCGGDKLDILSPINFGGGITEALYSLIPHEFFHVFHNHMAPDPTLIGGFYTEGMAEIMAYGEDTEAYLANRDWYFKEGIERFISENGRDPNLADIIPDTDGYMSVYSYGMAFWHYMLENHATHVELKTFFNQKNNWDVFNSSYEDIDSGYIHYLKVLAGIIDENVEYNKTFASGWNWFSVYLVNEDMGIGNILSSLAPQDGDYIKDRKGEGHSATYYDGFGWFGTLEDIDPAETYKINLTNAGELIYNGLPLDLNNTEIPVTSGWNWIGYPIEESMAVYDYLSTLTLADGDYLKDQINSTTFYDGFGWFGQLEQMMPGNGYVLKVSNQGSIHQPQQLKSALHNINDNAALFSRFEHSGSVTIKIESFDSEDNILYAFNENDEMAGKSKAKYFEPTNSNLFAPIIFSNNPGEEIYFKLHDVSTDQWIVFDEKLTFESDMIIANAYQPFLLRINADDEENRANEVYPNPFINELNIRFNVDYGQQVEVSILNAQGYLIELISNKYYPEGTHQESWLAEKFSEGIYYVRIKYETNIESIKVLKIK